MPNDTTTTTPPGAPWHTLTAQRTLEHLATRDTGLSTAEATQRLARHGPNVIPRAGREGPLQLLWRQIHNPLIWVLLGAAVLALVMGKLTDGAVVLGVVVLNGLIGFVQEYRANRAIEALSAMVPQVAAVLRDGQRTDRPAADLVPGDVVSLQSGDQVPADLRLLGVRGLLIDEAALTGESLPVAKQAEPVPADAALGDRTCLAFGGTLVTFGTATAVVIATGADTELGRISLMLKETTALETPLTRALATIAKYITIAIITVSIALLVIGTGRMAGQGLALSAALQDAVLFAIALAVGAIPEGLPAIVTIALAIGVQRMAARRAIVRKLPAVETLGSTTVICTDKTGTLTRNEMTVQEVWTPAGAYELTGVGYAPTGELWRHHAKVTPTPPAVHTLLLDGALCNDANLHQDDGHWQIAGDPTEGALVVAAEKLGITVATARQQWPRLDAIPFESEHKCMVTLHDTPDGAQRIIVKGAPEVVVQRCTVCAGGRRLDAEGVLHEVERLAAKGMRVLALATRTPTTHMTRVTWDDVAVGFEFAGLQGMIDPPRPEAIEAVKTCHAAGITVKMITGDHKGTAKAIGRQLGLSKEGTVVTGAELAAMDAAQVHEAAGRVNVFARVAPEHKLKLVRALQDQHHVVAMTGDGVNDAPALKQADVGVAMGITGTAVSKEAADIVLADDNFASIAAAVEEGRRVYDNLVKSLAFLLPTNVGQALVLVVAVLLFPFDPTSRELLLPMLPTHLLWINMVTGVALALPLAFEAKEPDLMARPPRAPREPVLGAFLIVRSLLVAALICAGTVGLFYYEYTSELRRGADPHRALAEAQTLAVTTVAMYQVFYLLNCRSLKDSLLHIGLWSNRTVYIGIGVLLLLQAIFIYGPWLQGVFHTAALPADALLKAALVGLTVLPVIAVEKWVRQQQAASARSSR